MREVIAPILSLIPILSVLLAQNPNLLQGNVAFNGENYKARCDCSAAAKGNCNPTDIRIVKDRNGQGATAVQIRSLFSVTSFNVQPILSTPFVCVDGRHTGSHLYTPGGDAGELLTALVIYERSLGRSLTQAEVKSAISTYLATMTQPTLYFCIDDNAQTFLQNAAGYVTVNLTQPIQSRRTALLTYVANAQAQGDLFFSLLIKNPAKYGINTSIVSYFIVSLYQLLWLQSDQSATVSPPPVPKIQLLQLSGQHTETAFIDIRIGTVCMQALQSPLFPTKSTSVTSPLSVYTNHMDAASVKRKSFAQFVVNSLARGNAAFTLSQFTTRLQSTALSFFNNFGLLIAAPLPFFTISLIL